MVLLRGFWFENFGNLEANRFEVLEIWFLSVSRVRDFLYSEGYRVRYVFVTEFVYGIDWVPGLTVDLELVPQAWRLSFELGAISQQ